MQIFQFLLSFIIHIDQHLLELVQNYGMWVYAILFLIFFVETGIVVFPFLPGDSLLFIAGALSATGKLDYVWLTSLLFIAAILGDQCNYTIGKWLGPKVFQWENSRFFNKKAFAQANHFYERYGGITIVVARFMPFMRTFVPFVAGIAAMRRNKFIFFNVFGAALWVIGLTTAGYFFGNLAWVQQNLSIIIWGLILLPGVLALWGAWKTQRK